MDTSEAKLLLSRKTIIWLIIIRMSNAIRIESLKKSKIPGPGQYHPEDYKGTKGLAFGKKNTVGGFLGTAKNVPGPGQYDVTRSASAATKGKVAGGSFGIKTGGALSGRPSTARHVGPGTYGPGDSIAMSKSKSVA